MWKPIWLVPVVAIVFLIIVGCEQTTSDLGSANPPAAGVSNFNDRIAKDGLLTFRSWSGKLLRTDSDTEITFLPEQRVHMTEYGYVVNSYDGAIASTPAERSRLSSKNSGTNCRSCSSSRIQRHSSYHRRTPK